MKKIAYFFQDKYPSLIYNLRNTRAHLISTIISGKILKKFYLLGE